MLLKPVVDGIENTFLHFVHDKFEFYGKNKVDFWKDQISFSTEKIDNPSSILKICNEICGGTRGGHNWNILDFCSFRSVPELEPSSRSALNHCGIPSPARTEQRRYGACRANTAPKHVKIRHLVRRCGCCDPALDETSQEQMDSATTTKRPSATPVQSS